MEVYLTLVYKAPDDVVVLGIFTSKGKASKAVEDWVNEYGWAWHDLITNIELDKDVERHIS